MKPPKIQTREQAEAAMDALAIASHRRDKLEAEMNLRLTAVREKYETEMAELAVSIKTETERLHAWADSHPEAFDSSRSVKLLHGVVGYRLGNWAVKLIRGFKLERAVALVKSVLGPAYVRTGDELDKELVLADRAHIPPEALTSCGLRLEQAEAFYATPEKSEAPQCASPPPRPAASGSPSAPPGSPTRGGTALLPATARRQRNGGTR